MSAVKKKKLDPAKDDVIHIRTAPSIIGRWAVAESSSGVFLASLIEALIISRRRTYDWKAMGVSLFDLVGRKTISLLLPISIAAPFFRFAWHHRFTTIELNSVVSVAILVFIQDFFFYWSM